MYYSSNFSEVLWKWDGNYTGLEQYLYTNASFEKQGITRYILVGGILSVLSLAACLGNILVVLSVFTNRRLRTVTNCYVVSLALSDLCVSMLVMPLGIVVELTGKWHFGSILCEIWVSGDVMLCTASILNLCCISLDRYFAITKPLVYSTKRSKRLALSMIAVVWVSAVVITCPPIFGWQEEGRLDDSSFCTLTKDPGYIIYSSLGSFYVPLTVMVFVYIRIFIVAIKREKRLRPYKRTYVSGALRKHRGRRKSNTKLRCNSETMSESLSLTVAREESRDSEDTDEKSIETRLIKENGGRKCLSVRRLHEGLVINSAVAMHDIARAHRNTKSCSHRKVTVAHNTSSNSYQLRKHAKSHPPSSNVNQNHHPFVRSPTSRRSAVDTTQPMDYFAKRDERRKERAALLKEHKAAKTLAIVVGGFVVCWLPFFLMYIIAPFCDCYIDPHMESFFTWLGYFNSVLNPGIYALYNRDFRYSFWKLTFGRCRHRRNPDQFA